MKIHLENWDGDLALRIPQSLARQLALKPNSRLEVFTENGKLILSPVPEVTLEQLLEGFSEENLHGEIGTGIIIGREIW